MLALTMFSVATNHEISAHCIGEEGVIQLTSSKTISPALFRLFTCGPFPATLPGWEQKKREPKIGSLGRYRFG